MYEQSPVTKRIREKLPAAVQPFLFSFKSEPSPSGSSSWVEDAPPSTSDLVSPDISDSIFFSTSSSHVSPEESDEPDPPTAQGRLNSEMQLVPFRDESPKLHQPRPTAISTFSPLPSLRFLSVPRQLHTPLSFFGPEHLQVSDTSSSELDLSLCVLPFFGCNIPKHHGS